MLRICRAILYYPRLDADVFDISMHDKFEEGGVGLSQRTSAFWKRVCCNSVVCCTRGLLFRVVAIVFC